MTLLLKDRLHVYMQLTRLDKTDWLATAAVAYALGAVAGGDGHPSMLLVSILPWARC